jgi:hypothetical protein
MRNYCNYTQTPAPPMRKKLLKHPTNTYCTKHEKLLQQHPNTCSTNAQKTTETSNEHLLHQA